MADYDSSNPKHIAIARKSAKAADEARASFINNIMGMVDGRAYIHDLLVSCHVFTQPFSANALVTAFACGELNIGQRILADIMAYCPDDYIQMMREANARSTADDARRSRSDKDADGNNRGPEPYIHPAQDYGADDAAGTTETGNVTTEYDPTEDRDQT